MSLQKPLEGLLRPPLEWYAAGVMIFSSILALSYPRLFFLSNKFSSLVSLLLFAMGVWRFKQGYRIWRYQRHLKQTPAYRITSSQLPVSSRTLFLGKGFLWTTEHTQRLRDLDLDYNLNYKMPSRFSRRKRQNVLVGGQACIHGVAEKESDIAISLTERASHLVVVGLPGMGKTRFAELLIGQDIRRGDVVIVLDPKGDADLLKRIYSEAKLAGREQDLLVFHLGFPESSCRYNPIGNFTRVTEVANRISNQLPSSGDSAAFKDFGWQFINSMAMALVSMGEKPDYKKMKFYITKMDVLLEKYLNAWLPTAAPDSEKWIQKYLRDNNTEKKTASRLDAMIAYVQAHALIDNPVFDDLHHACKYDKEYFSKITASLGPLLKKLTTGKSAQLLSPDYGDIQDHRPILDWLQVIRNKQIVYVGLDALTDREVATAVGNAMFSDLVSVAGRLYKFGLHDGFYKTAMPDSPLPRVCVHSDEFNEIIGDEFIPLLNKGRGAGFTVTAYTQTWSDVEARLKSAAKAGQVAGNFGTIVMFRCQEVKTIQMLLEKLPKVAILRTLASSGSTDTPHGDHGVFYQSVNQDTFTHIEHRLIEANDVLNLPKGQAFCLLEGGKLYKLRMPMPQAEMLDLPTDLNHLLRLMHHQKIVKQIGERKMTRATLNIDATNFFDHYWPCLTGEAIAKHREFQPLCDEIQSLISAPAKLYIALYQTTLWRLMEFCQAMPQDMQQPQPYSVLQIALETAVAALKIRRGECLPPQSNSETIAEQEPLWTYAVFTAGLFAQLPDLQSDRTIVLYKNEKEKIGLWHPMAGSLYEPHTFYKILQKPHPTVVAHSHLIAACLGRIIPKTAHRWLSSYPEIWTAWWETMIKTPGKENILQPLIQKISNTRKNASAIKNTTPEITSTKLENKPAEKENPPTAEEKKEKSISTTDLTQAKVLADFNAWIMKNCSPGGILHKKKHFLRLEAGVLIRFKGLEHFIAEYPSYDSSDILLQQLSGYLKKDAEKTPIFRYHFIDKKK